MFQLLRFTEMYEDFHSLKSRIADLDQIQLELKDNFNIKEKLAVVRPRKQSSSIAMASSSSSARKSSYGAAVENGTQVLIIMHGVRHFLSGS